MATLKNPSIYDDRGTIGSADELDAYGVWVKIEPEELSDVEADQFPDFDADFGPELPLDETVGGDAAFEEFPFSDQGEDADFDDVEALMQDIQSAPPAETAYDAALGSAAAEPGRAEPAETAASPDRSTQLLKKIVDDLSSIKNELSALKEELSAIRSEKPPRGGEGEDAGFFDEEDDDKIALTGDELNNIIHTADFTEETGFDAGASLADDLTPPDTSAPAEALGQPSPSDDGGDIIYDGLGRPLRRAAPESGGGGEPAAAAAEESPETDAGGAGGEIIYDGLGRPLNRKIVEDGESNVSLDASLDVEDSEALQALRENGVEPMTAPPEDTSYLEEDPLVEDDPLAEEDLDLSDAVIDEPDLSEGVRDAPLEEPSLDNLALIDLETLEEGGEKADVRPEEPAEEKPFFEDITFEDLSDLNGSLESEGITEIENLDEGETIDLSIFEDDFPLEDVDEPDGSLDFDSGDLSFEVLDEDAELPVQQTIQDNVITEDSFEPISFDDEGGLSDITIDEDLEQSLPEGMKIELEDLPPLDLPSLGEGDDENFSRPGFADSAEAGDQTSAPAEGKPAVKTELREVLIYMDKLLESLPEDKINEFAQSEHYNTYKKLFEELGIPQ